jgi:hypothetical protein
MALRFVRARRSSALCPEPECYESRRPKPSGSTATWIRSTLRSERTVETPTPRKIRVLRPARPAAAAQPDWSRTTALRCEVTIWFRDRSRARSAPEAATRAALQRRCRRISSVASPAPATIAPASVLWDRPRHGKTVTKSCQSAGQHVSFGPMPRTFRRAQTGLRLTGQIVHAASIPRPSGDGFEPV